MKNKTNLVPELKTFNQKKKLMWDFLNFGTGTQRKSAFTLVELIVVITILAILWTIAFISLQWYTKTARDSTRISDLSTMKTWLELFNLDAGKYPLPTNSFTVTYSWSEVWTQWTFWETTTSNVEKLDKIPTDPLTSKEYTYSVTKTKQEFQLSWMFETTDLVLNNTLSQTNAWDIIATAVVTWNYNWALTKTNSWTNCEILSVPSIISSQSSSTTDLTTILTNKWLVYNWFNNLPNNYASSKYNNEWWFDFTSNKLIVYSDTNECKPLFDANDNTARTTLVTNLQTAYTGTIIWISEWISNVSSLDLSDLYSVNFFARSLVNNLFGWKLDIWKLPIISPFTLPSDLTQIFANNNEWTENWNNNLCDPSNISIIEVSPWTDTIYTANWSSYTLQDNTIYKLSAWNYINNSLLTLWNCNAIIWDWNVNLYSNIQITFWWQIRSLLTKNNIILYWLNIDWINDGIWGTHSANINWISFLSSNTSIINVNSFNNSSGIYIDGLYNFLENIELYNNYRWLYILSDYSKINNIFSYNNDFNIYTNFANYNNFSNIDLYDSTTQYWLYMAESNNNNLKNIKTYSNTRDWVLVAWSINNSFNNIESFNNAWNGIFSYSTSWTPVIDSEFNVYNNINVYNNNSYGVILSYTGGVINNWIIYNHGNIWLRLQSLSFDTVLNNVSVYNSPWCGYSYCGWLFAYDTSVIKKYYWNLTLFGTVNDQFDWLIAGTWSSIFNDWVLNEPVITMSCDFHSQPWDWDWWSNCENIQKQTLTTPVTWFNYGVNIPKQSRPVRYNGWVLEYYGVDWVDYDSSKYIGER